MLFFRMGDFYELFFEDARRRLSDWHHADQTQPTWRRTDPDGGRAVAPGRELSLQTHPLRDSRLPSASNFEDPAEAKKRGGKSIVQRGVVRVVTPVH